MAIAGVVEFVIAHGERGSCRCGKCIDAPAEEHQPTGHTANLEFFEVCLKGDPDAAELRRLVQDSVDGEFNQCDLFDGKDHSYIEIGGWIGDQGLAMMLMGIGHLLGLWKLLTPTSIFGEQLPKETRLTMAGNGLVVINSGQVAMAL